MKDIASDILINIPLIGAGISLILALINWIYYKISEENKYKENFKNSLIGISICIGISLFIRIVL